MLYQLHHQDSFPLLFFLKALLRVRTLPMSFSSAGHASVTDHFHDTFVLKLQFAHSVSTFLLVLSLLLLYPALVVSCVDLLSADWSYLSDSSASFRFSSHSAWHNYDNMSNS
jgi:hypothetical protein